jgi:hypothetical protein
MANLSVLTQAANLADTNPAASELLIELDNAETAAQVIEALDNYDAGLSDN